MGRNTHADDPRPTRLKTEMAEHFAEFEATYRDEEWCSVVYEDAEVVVIADHKGYEFDEWSKEFASIDRREFSTWMHDLARQVTDYNWSTSYPVVFDKMEDSR